MVFEFLDGLFGRFLDINVQQVNMELGFLSFYGNMDGIIGLFIKYFQSVLDAL